MSARAPTRSPFCRLARNNKPSLGNLIPSQVLMALQTRATVVPSSSPYLVAARTR